MNQLTEEEIREKYYELERKYSELNRKYYISLAKKPDNFFRVKLLSMILKNGE